MTFNQDQMSNYCFCLHISKMKLVAVPEVYLYVFISQEGNGALVDLSPLYVTDFFPDVIGRLL